MATKNLIPRGDGEGGIGKPGLAWGSGVFKTGDFEEIRVQGSPLSIGADQIDFNSSLIPDANANYDLGSAEKKIRHLYLSDNSLNIGTETISLDGEKNLILPSGLKLGGEAVIKKDENSDKIVFSSTPSAIDSEGEPTPLLSSDKFGLGTSAVLDLEPQDVQFKFLTDENRLVIGTDGSAGGLAKGWYRFNDAEVKGASDIGSHKLNPVDTRVYSDKSSFILFTTDTAGNRVAHLVGGDEKVSANNAIALGIAVKTDDTESPEDIEFVHTDGESYSVINGDSDSLGTNGLPIRQGFQAPPIGANPSPLLIDGGYF
jgi:hypothetical protein